MTKKAVKQILEILDQEYGTTKEGFLHYADWQLLLAIMLSAQSTDKQVYEVLPKLWTRFSAVEDMAEAPVEEIEEYIKSIGLYKSKANNMKKCCRQIIDEYHGNVPRTVTVDTQVLRIARRLGWAKGNNPVQVEQELMKVLPKENWNRINFQLIYHGRSVCTARKCHCDKCTLNSLCEKRDACGTQ